ncbi:MAG: excinuclease ABC subunit UvrB [bacterium]|nr:excinuclease ABC subunit UvrB [bacterium]
MSIFKLKSKFKPDGDQPKAIESLVAGLKKGFRHQTLLGVTGSGKTFTVANVIKEFNKPVLVIAHNKTLAAQLAQEYRDFFPAAAVHYFVSYYDYYQPEAYMPITDTYIEKDAAINKEIERLRHASTAALLTRPDTIIVASVSCIYGLGSPEEYAKENLLLKVGQKLDRADLLEKLVQIYYERTNADLTPGTFRAIGSSVEIMPPSEKEIYRLDLSKGQIEVIEKIDAVSRVIISKPKNIILFPAKHFITPEHERERAMKAIKQELDGQIKKFEQEGKLLEAERIKRRTTYDLAMIREVGYTSGIENYSRHLAGREAGSSPDTLLNYFPHNKDGSPDFLTIIDESHVTVPQIGGMYAGDQSRKKTLVEYGFRLPSAKDNRPLQFREFEERVGQVIYTSATPANYECEHSQNIVEQIIRPTGLVDPELTVKPISQGRSLGASKDRPLYPGQIKDFIAEAKKEIAKGHRAMATTLTKKMAEDLAEFLKQEGIKTEYLHSDVKTLDRITILTEFRRGSSRHGGTGFDCLVGVNLLREGLDLPEVSFIGILDADKEGFLRSDVSLIQTIGRAARNASGRVTLYADNITGSMERAMGETNRRRVIQLAYNKKHGITPQTIIKKIHDITESLELERNKAVRNLLALDRAAYGGNIKKLLKEKEKQMSEAVKNLDFETAAILRDEIKELVASK